MSISNDTIRSTATNSYLSSIIYPNVTTLRSTYGIEQSVRLSVVCLLRCCTALELYGNILGLGQFVIKFWA